MAETAVKTDPKEKFISDYAEFEERHDLQSSDYIKNLRSKAIRSFNTLGFPTKKVESWKYTSLKPILEYDYKPAFSLKEAAKVEESDIQDPLKENYAARLVFVNGIFSESLSDLDSLSQKGVTVLPLSKAFSERQDTVEQYYGRWAAVNKEAVAALNTAFATEGVFIEVARNTILEKPINLIFVSDGREENYVAHPRNLFLFGESSHAKIVENHQAIGDNPVLTNLVNEVKVEANAEVEHYRVQDNLQNHFHISNTYVNEDKDSRIKTHVTTFDGALVRNGLFANINGENVDSAFEGLYVPEGSTHVDNRTFVEHSKGQSQSDQLYKGVLKDKSTGVFDGEIYVHPHSQQTNAFQLNQNVLMDDTATAHTKPQLEIFADDVKCSHGATTGTVDEEAIFYLKARCIPEKQARAMILFAFANEVLERVKIDELRESLAQKLDEVLSR